ncbi:hypothetical protein NP233_g366 [Leucocoprinus birnbaumii]|uniref:RanBD1 domain-containing protein n=1 Tax=Leucocoprinus birnbaumii TaxID=56174 RepID=A0AAD5YYP5_9AGAR|nr:hypothetical protein NP233_g366 [Leucocoprinus birnbaumii]
MHQSSSYLETLTPIINAQLNVMFPVSDFNFMVAGIATFAATVGYSLLPGQTVISERGEPDNVSEAKDQDQEMAAPNEKRQAVEKKLPEAGPSSAKTPNTPVRQESLKRKEPHDGFDEEDTEGQGAILFVNSSHTHSLEAQSTPRQSTPLVLEDSATEDWILIHNINSPNATINEPPRTPSPGAETAAAPTPATEVADSPLLVTAPIPSAEDNTSGDATPVITPQELDRAVTPVAAPAEEQPEITKVEKPEPVPPKAAEPPAKDSGERKPAAFGKTSAFTPISSFQKISFQKPITSPFATRGFADFAGNKSPFSAFTTSQAAPQKIDRPVWLAGNGDAPSPESKNETDEEHALTQVKSTAKPMEDRVTGEENEDVVMDLKGVKLFVKRGDKPFAEGMVGHCKLLKDRTTSEERLLFRREPLWKISMNARVNASLRCSFDPTENALRIVTKEAKSDGTTDSTDQTSLEIVVYAMKPGRLCSKQDFKAFSETLLKNPLLRATGSA